LPLLFRIPPGLNCLPIKQLIGNPSKLNKLTIYWAKVYPLNMVREEIK